jgi:hypothetical protein
MNMLDEACYELAKSRCTFGASGKHVNIYLISRNPLHGQDTRCIDDILDTLISIYAKEIIVLETYSSKIWIEFRVRLSIRATICWRHRVSMVKSSDYNGLDVILTLHKISGRTAYMLYAGERNSFLS